MFQSYDYYVPSWLGRSVFRPSSNTLTITAVQTDSGYNVQCGGTLTTRPTWFKVTVQYTADLTQGPQPQAPVVVYAGSTQSQQVTMDPNTSWDIYVNNGDSSTATNALQIYAYNTTTGEVSNTCAVNMPNSQHTSCVNGVCTIVNGAGSDECPNVGTTCGVASNQGRGPCAGSDSNANITASRVSWFDGTSYHQFISACGQTTVDRSTLQGVYVTVTNNGTTTGCVGANIINSSGTQVSTSQQLLVTGGQSVDLWCPLTPGNAGTYTVRAFNLNSNGISVNNLLSCGFTIPSPPQSTGSGTGSTGSTGSGSTSSGNVVGYKCINGVCKPDTTSKVSFDDCYASCKTTGSTNQGTTTTLTPKCDGIMLGTTCVPLLVIALVGVFGAVLIARKT